MGLLGLPEFEAALVKVAKEADEAARAAVAKTAALAEAGAKKEFEGAHSKGEPHVGGDKPNVVTGTLRRSIRTDPIKRYRIGDYGTIVAPRAIYARAVELGQHEGAPKYPYFVPGVKEARDRFRGIAAAEWAKFLR